MCPECGSGDISFFKIRDKVKIYKCNTCGEEFVRQEDIE